MLLYAVWTVVVISAGIEESLSQTLSDIDLENVSLSVEQKEASRNIIIGK